MTDDTLDAAHPAVETVLTGRPRGDVDDWRDRCSLDRLGTDARPGWLAADDETRVAALRGAANLVVLDAAAGDGGAVVADGTPGVGRRDEVPGVAETLRDLADGEALRMAVDGVPEDWRERLPGWTATREVTGVALDGDPGELFAGHRDEANVARGAFLNSVRDAVVTDALADRIAEAGGRRDLDDLRSDVGTAVLDAAAETAENEVNGVIRRLMDAGHVALDDGDLCGAGKTYATGLTRRHAPTRGSETDRTGPGGRTAGR